MDDLKSQIFKASTFNEKDSVKANEVKKVFSSKLFLFFIIFYIAMNVLNVVSMLIITIQSSSGNIDYVSLLLQCATEAIIPFFFGRLLILEYRTSKGLEKNRYYSPLERLLSIRGFSKVFLIGIGILYIICGISMMNYESIVTETNKLLPESEQIVFTEAEFAIIKQTGFSFFFNAVFYFMIAFSLLKTSKLAYQSIIFDTENNSQLNINFIISIVIVSLYGLFRLIGCILWSIGISTFLCPGIANFSSTSDILILIAEIFLVIYIIIGTIILYKLMKAVKNHKGSLNPLDGENVFTLSPDDIKVN